MTDIGEEIISGLSTPSFYNTSRMERQLRESYPGKNIARKLLGFISKRKREEERKRMDLWKAMRDSSIGRDSRDSRINRLAAVIASARMEFGDRLSDLCQDAERVLQRLLRENRSGTQRKVTLRERLLLADIEAESSNNNCTNSGEVETSTTDTPPMLQAVLNLMRPSSDAQAGNAEVASTSGMTPSHNANGRRLLSALLWEERNLDNPDQRWVAFGVQFDHSRSQFDHSRSQSVRGDLNRVSLHRPSSSVGGASSVSGGPEITTTSLNFAPDTASVPETPMRVSLMSLLREAEEGSGIIFMNRQMIDSPDRPDILSDSMLVEMCCVCMGRQKGAAFIPCGHTFCRRCSKDLQQARGTCPLCNKEIVDILNLY